MSTLIWLPGRWILKLHEFMNDVDKVSLFILPCAFRYPFGHGALFCSPILGYTSVREGVLL